MEAAGLAERALDEAVQCGAGAIAEPRGVDKFFISRHNPLVAEVEADDEPERRACGVRGEEVHKIMLFNGIFFHALILKHAGPNKSTGWGYSFCAKVRGCYFLFMTSGAFSIILDDQSRVLLCKRRDKDLWNLPGGKVEQGESPWAAAIREAREEINVDIAIDKLVGVYFKKEQEEIVFQFLSRIERGIPSESEEAREIAYFNADNLPENTAPRQKERIKLFFENQNTVRMLDQ